MIYLILLTILFAYLLLWVIKQYFMYNQIAHIPGPTPLPLVGNALELGIASKEFLVKFHGLAEKYGSVVRMCLGQQNGIMITDSKYIEQVLTATKNSPKGEVFEIVEPLIGNGLVSSSGDTWSRHRRILNTAFSNEQLKKYVRVFNHSANNLVENLKEKADFNAVDITDIVIGNALTALCKMTMAVEFTKNTAFHATIHKLFQLFTERFSSPLKRFNFLYRFTEDYRLTKKCTTTIHKTMKDIIDKRRQELKENNANCVLDKLLSLQGEDALTDKELRDEIITLIAKGIDPLGVTISFCLYELAKQPSIQKKILEEIESVLGEDDGSFENLQQLKYTECVLKETLRLYPSLPFTTRVIQSDMYLDGYCVPAKTMVIIFIQKLHMSEANYPDPEKFDPDRFLPENCIDRSPSLYIPFGAGVRTCIGEKIAMQAAKVMLTKIIRNFELHQHPGHKPFVSWHGALKSTNGLPVVLKVRRPST